MRPACPPLVNGCKFLNFSRSRSEMDLAARKAVEELGDRNPCLEEYADCGSAKHCAMVERIRHHLSLTTLKYQRLDDLVKAIGLPKEKLCTYCWDGVDGRTRQATDNRESSKAAGKAVSTDPHLAVPMPPLRRAPKAPVSRK